MIDIIEPHIVNELTFEEKLHHTRWEVLLSDGRTVYSKPSRRSWLELKKYIELHDNININGLKFAFRDNVVDIYSGKADYFFTNAIICEYGGPVINYFIGGCCEPGENRIHCKKYLIPEMFLVEEEWRDLDDESVKRGLISYVDIIL